MDVPDSVVSESRHSFFVALKNRRDTSLLKSLSLTGKEELPTRHGKPVASSWTREPKKDFPCPMLVSCSSQPS